MKRALELARMGRFGASPNPMVGAVIVAADGSVIGEGFHARCGGPHAEVRAVESVVDKSKIAGSTVYVTLEPCAHYGKTPPCAAMLVRERVGRVVVGCIDPFAKVAGRGIDMLRDAGIDVTVGVCESECRRINRKFFTAHTLHRPYVTLKWACSSDGWMDIRRSTDHPGAAKLSSPVTRLDVMALRAENDAILVGSGTVLADNPALTVRGLYGRQPARVILDRRGRIPADAAVFDNNGARIYHITDPEASLPDILRLLYENSVTSLLVEGGACVLNSFLDAGLWDEARCETAPVTLGNEGRTKAPQLPHGITETAENDGRLITTVYRQHTHSLTFDNPRAAHNSDF